MAQAYALHAPARKFGGRLALRQRGLELATKALQLDPNLAEAYNALGWFRMYFEYDWNGTRDVYKRALELNPSLAEAHHGYSHYLAIHGRFEEALNEARQSLELSPFDRIYRAHEPWTLYMARRYDEALEGASRHRGRPDERHRALVCVANS